MISQQSRSRSSPQGFWRYSADYLLAARCVDTHLHKSARVHFPTLNLYGIAIELSLKAFLLKRGKSLKDVKGLSHDLDKAVTMARTHKLGREVKLDKNELVAIKVLNITYSSSRLRYIDSGTSSVPVLLYLSRAAERLVVDLEMFCTGKRGRIERAL